MELTRSEDPQKKNGASLPYMACVYVPVSRLAGSLVEGATYCYRIGFGPVLRTAVAPERSEAPHLIMGLQQTISTEQTILTGGRCCWVVVSRASKVRSLIHFVGKLYIPPRRTVGYRRPYHTWYRVRTRFTFSRCLLLWGLLQTLLGSCSLEELQPTR